MTVATAITVLLTAWRNSPDPDLELLTFPKYPYRELRPVQLSETAVCVTVAFRGFGYKNRGPRPRQPPTPDLDSIREIFNLALLPDYRITNVQNLGRDISIIMEEVNYDKSISDDCSVCDGCSAAGSDCIHR